MGQTCKPCLNIFGDFGKRFDLVNAVPPKKKGVYIIEIGRKPKTPLQKIIRQVDKHVDRILDGSNQFDDIKDRIERLNYITGSCNVIYIGGNLNKSNQTLEGRYGNLLRTHTVMLPLYVLLLADFKLNIRFLEETAKPHEKEKLLLDQYKMQHGNCPALNYNKDNEK